MNNKIKKTWDRNFFIIKKKNHWFVIPSIVVYYNKHEFYETGVTTPCWGLMFRWLVFMIGFQIQEGYEYQK
jgi:hypothetical protein